MFIGVHGLVLIMGSTSLRGIPFPWPLSLLGVFFEEEMFFLSIRRAPRTHSSRKCPLQTATMVSMVSTRLLDIPALPVPVDLLTVTWQWLWWLGDSAFAKPFYPLALRKSFFSTVEQMRFVKNNHADTDRPFL